MKGLKTLIGMKVFCFVLIVVPKFHINNEKGQAYENVRKSKDAQVSVKVYSAYSTVYTSVYCTVKTGTGL